MLAPAKTEGIGIDGIEGNEGIFGSGIEILGIEIDRLGDLEDPPAGNPGILGADREGIDGKEGKDGIAIFGKETEGTDNDNGALFPPGGGDGNEGRDGITNFGNDIEIPGNSGIGILNFDSVDLDPIVCVIFNTILGIRSWLPQMSSI